MHIFFTKSGHYCLSHVSVMDFLWMLIAGELERGYCVCAHLLNCLKPELSMHGALDLCINSWQDI